MHIRESCFEVSLCFDPLAEGGIFSHRMSAYYRRRPSEATALGNVLVQLRALGVVADRDSMRRLAAGAVSLQRYEPCDTELWNEKYVIFKKKCNLL